MNYINRVFDDETEDRIYAKGIKMLEEYRQRVSLTEKQEFDYLMGVIHGLRVGLVSSMHDFSVDGGRETMALVHFGGRAWEWLKSVYPCDCNEDGQMMIEWAEESGLCKQVIYDLDAHGDIGDVEAGDTIYWWGCEA